MAPKKRLLRRTRAANGQTNLEEVAAERIDAVTAEPLHAKKYVEIMSPDGTLRLFYNTATLIRIATDRAMFMQPPHFREPMAPALQRQVEEIEGRTFHFEKKNVFLQNDSATSDGGLHILHRHVYFDQIMDEFYLLNPAELYVCPACYLHWVSTRFIPHLQNTRQRIEYVADDPNPVIDPLDVLAHMQGVENTNNNNNNNNNNNTDAEGRNSIGNDINEVDQVPLTIPSANELPDWDSPLVHIVFRRAIHWRQHVRHHHSSARTAAVDYRLKEFLSQYISQYNRLTEEKYRKRRRNGDDSVIQRPTLTVPRYWHINARYNRLRYNRIVEAVEHAEPYINDCVHRSVFPNETVMNTFHSNDKDSSGSDFICDSDSSSSDSGYNAFPRYEDPLGLGSEEEEEEEEEEAPNSRKRQRSRRNISSSSSSLSTTDDDEDEEESDEEEGKRERQRELFKKGLLAPFSGPYRDLSYEERRVLDANSRRVFKPTVLYAPPQEDDDYYINNNNNNVEVLEEEEDEHDGEYETQIDWSQIGETIENASVYVRHIQERSFENTPQREVKSKNNFTEIVQQTYKKKSDIYTENGSPSIIKTKIMLDDDVEAPELGAIMTTQISSAPDRNQRLLLDDSD